MPRSLPIGLKEVLKSSYAESHSTLELSLPSDFAPSITYYFATARLTIGGVVYDRQLRNSDAVKTSLTKAADRVTVELQNVDTILGVDFLRVADSLYGANVKFGRYWKDLRSAATFHHTLLTGCVAGVEINENVARLTLISDTYAAVSVGAREQVLRQCRFQVQGEFRGTACGYSGALLTCNGLYDSADGCEGRHGTPLKQAKFGGFVYIEGKNTVAGAASLPVPAYNQLMKLADSAGTVSTTSKQQPFLALHEDGFSLNNDDTNEQTRIVPKFPVQAINVVFDHSAVADGVTSASSAVAAAISAANSTGRPLYFPAGTYLINEALFTNLNSLKIFGDGAGRSILKSSDSTKAVLNINAAASASHTISIEDLSIEGAGTGSNNHGIYIHGAQGVFNITVRNVTIRDCGGKGLYSTDSAFTQLFEAVDVSDCGDNAIDFGSGNTTVLSRCYVHNVATNKAAYRVRYGDVTMVGCNGIDSGTTADWGVFGQDTATDGTDTYARVILHGCNIEDFTNRGVYCKSGSFASFFATPILAPASGTVKAIKLDFVSTDSCGIFDAASSINTKGASWSNSEPVHSSGMPFVQIGHRDFSTYYDTNVGASTSLPGLTGTLIAGSTDYALTFDGWTRFKNPSRIDESTAPGTPPANSIFLYAKDVSGTSGLFFKNDAGTEFQLGTGIAGSLTSGQVVYATGSNTVTTSGNFAWDNSAKALIITSAGLNGAVYVTDTTNTITARIGTLAGAPDRGIAGTTTNHPFVLYQNNAEAWGVDASKHFRPYNGATAQDLGVASVPIRDVHVGGNVVFYERTAPSTPAANTLVLYAKDNGGTSALYFKNDAGTETEIGASSSANAALSNLASVAINTALVSDTNNTDDLGSSSIAWKDLYLAGTFNLLARSDPGSPTNNDFWRSSTRGQLSIRNSGQTENLSATMWKSSASVFFDTTTTETSIISDTGVGTKTLAANRLVVGSQIRIKASGLYGTKASSPGTFTVKVKNGATTMLTIAAFTVPTNVADQNWWIEAVGSLSATGSSGTIYWTINFYYNDGTGALKTQTYAVNSTTINTTTTNALDVTGKFSVSDVANFWQTDVASIEIF